MSVFDRFKRTFCAVMVLGMAACGGGGGVASAPAPPALNVSGSVAVGAPLAAAQVDVKCATGTGSAATDAQGAYTASIPGGSGPCMVKASAGTLGAGGPANTETLLGATDAAGKANVTPLTQLILASALAQDPHAAFQSTALPVDKLGAASLDSAWASVKTSLQGFGVDVSALGVNPIGASFTPGSADDPLDLALEALQTRMATLGGTLAGLTQALASGNTDLAAASCPVTQQGADYLGPSCWKHIAQGDPQVNDVTVAAGVTTLGAQSVKLTKQAGAGLIAADVGAEGSLTYYNASYTLDDQIVMLCRNENKPGDLGPNVAKHLLLAPSVKLRRDAAVLEALKGRTFHAVENCKVNSGVEAEFSRVRETKWAFNIDGTATFVESLPGEALNPWTNSAADLRSWLVQAVPILNDPDGDFYMSDYEFPEEGTGVPLYAIVWAVKPNSLAPGSGSVDVFIENSPTP